MILLSVAAVWLGIFLVFQVIRVERRLSAIPGPFLARFTDYWKVYHFLKGDYGETLYWWHQRHGNMIRTGPRHISVGDAKEVPRVYQVKPLLHKVSSPIPFNTCEGWPCQLTWRFLGKYLQGHRWLVQRQECCRA